jgi:hypothetical protein
MLYYSTKGIVILSSKEESSRVCTLNVDLDSSPSFAIYGTKTHFACAFTLLEMQVPLHRLVERLPLAQTSELTSRSRTWHTY